MKKQIHIFLSVIVICMSAFLFYGCGALPPNILSITVSPAQVCIGGTAALSCEASAPSGKTVVISWTVNAGSLSSGSGSSVTWTAPSTPGTYLAVVTVSDGSQSTSSSVNLVVIPSQLHISGIRITPSSTISPESQASISCEATTTSGRPITFSWTCTGGLLSSSNGSMVYWTAPVTPGNYSIRVTVSDSISTETSTLTMNVVSPPIISIVRANPTTVNLGGTSEVDCTATDPGGATLIYNWGATGGAISGTPGRPIVWTAPISGVTSGQVFTISVDVFNGVLHATGSANVTVVTAGNPIIRNVQTIPSGTISGGNVRVTLTCTAVGPNGDPIHYNWVADNGILEADTGLTVTWLTPTVASNTTCAITVTVTDDNNTSLTTQSVVKILVTP